MPARSRPRPKQQRSQVAIRELTEGEVDRLSELVGAECAVSIASKSRARSEASAVIHGLERKARTALDESLRAAELLTQRLASDVLAFYDGSGFGFLTGGEFAALRKQAMEIRDRLRGNHLRRRPARRPRDERARDLALEVAYLIKPQGALPSDYQRRLSQVLEVVLFRDGNGDPKTYVRYAMTALRAGQLPWLESSLARLRAAREARRRS